MRKPLAPDLDMKHVDTRYGAVIRTRRLITLVITTGIIGAGLVAAIIQGAPLSAQISLWLVLVVNVAVNLILLAIAQRQARAIGYAELPEELAIRTGIMFQKLVLVPYGRMQQVDITSGPLLTHYDLANVKLVTASATTNATIVGIARAEAERLRVKLTELGASSREGL